MLPTPTIIVVGAIAMVMVAVLTLVSTGSIFATLVVLGLAAALGYVLMQLGFLKVSTAGSEIDVSFYEKPPAPSAPKSIVPAAKDAKVLEPKEVFYVSGNEYTYDEAAAVCAAYDADLATYDQVNDAYSGGAEWCGYGWTQGGMALYPTQQSTWEQLQQEADATKRTACGRPGINGGYFDPQNKFGVNCYGVKPGMMKGMKFPLPVPGTSSGDFNRMVDKFKGMLSRMTVDPFNRDGWSEWYMNSHGGSQVKADMTKIKKAV